MGVSVKKVRALIPFSGAANGVPVLEDVLDLGTRDFTSGDILMVIDSHLGSSAADAFESTVVDALCSEVRRFDHKMAYEFRWNGALILWWVEA